jgi:hypothetical protein
MLTQREIRTYAEEMRRAADNAGNEALGQWGRLYERRLARPRENRLQIAEWYREYEEKTSTVLGCD